MLKNWKIWRKMVIRVISKIWQNYIWQQSMVIKWKWAYVISMEDANRNFGVINVPNSVLK